MYIKHLCIDTRKNSYGIHTVFGGKRNKIIQCKFIYAPKTVWQHYLKYENIHTVSMSFLPNIIYKKCSFCSYCFLSYRILSLSLCKCISDKIPLLDWMIPLLIALLLLLIPLADISVNRNES